MSASRHKRPLVDSPSQMWPLGCRITQLVNVRATIGRHERSRKHNSYLILLHSFLHAADAAVHCATHAPDSPQFCAQEKLFELQFETHSTTVWFCASRSLSTNVPAMLSVIPDISNRSAIMYLMASFPRGNKRSGRCFGILVRLVPGGLRVAEKTDTFTRSGAVSEAGSGPDCKRPLALMATSEAGDAPA